MSRLKDTYKNEIVDAMTKKFGYKNIMEVPKLDTNQAQSIGNTPPVREWEYKAYSLGRQYAAICHWTFTAVS